MPDGTRKLQANHRTYGEKPEDYNSSWSYDQVHRLCDGSDEVLTELLRKSHTLGPTEYARLRHDDSKICLFMATQDSSGELIQVALSRLLIVSFLAIPDDDIPEALKPRGVLSLDPDGTFRSA